MASKQSPPNIEGEDTLREIVARIACMFAGFDDNEYWKSAILSQHQEETEKSIELLQSHQATIERNCQCENVEIGSYDNQVCLIVPDTVTIKANNPDQDVRKSVSVDSCLAGEIYQLWKKGIVTTGCCCGHNKNFGYIGVEDEYIEQMKEMGYEVQPNSMYPEREDSFKPKSIKHLNQPNKAKE